MQDGRRREARGADSLALRSRRSNTYEIVDSPLPLRSYRSTLAVHGHDGHSHVRWEAEFEAFQPEQERELVEVFTGIYRDGLSSLRERLERVAAA